MHVRLCRFSFLVSVMVACSSSSWGASAESPEPLRVLFLGDRGHHRPADRAAQFIPVMHDRGIEVTYTERVDDLEPSTLAKYDAVVLYANIDAIAPAQEKALLDYVAGGGGFVPLHCASFCFRNSEPFVQLVGAQFQRHGTGEFDTKVTDTSHPIMKGLDSFRTWDETYVHTKHHPVDRVVLQTRTEGSGEEPWTWVRTHGKGRVFYTAYGHDGRTWSHPGFHDLVERGIRWAAHKGEVRDHRPRPRAELPPFAYEKAGDRIPNYLPGRRHGTQGEVITQMQKPLTPEESARHLVVPPGFEARLFAAEPEIAKPLCMAWDHRGRLWIAESTDYPNNLKKVGQGNDRITICEDTDGDGRADKFTVFADKLSIPTSMVFARNGLIVADAPDMLFLQDLDGDDRADVRKLLFTGWGTQDTHAGPSNLRHGFDNWIWGMVGYSGFNGVVGGTPLRFSQGFFRFKADGSALEFLRSTNNNTWGLGLTEEGIVFGSTANGCPSVYLPIPNRYYESVRGWSPQVLQSIAGWNRFYPVTDKVRQVDWHGGFTAGAGHAVYTARTYPKFYWNRTAFVAEPTGHLAATFLLEPNGADFASNNTWNLVASNDEWTAPINAEVGPDGNVWFIDWYNYIVQHNPTPQGFETGKGNAYVTSLRDKTHGRIYRVVYKNAKPSGITKLDPSDASSLVAALKSDNQFWRMHAQRLLVERGNRDVVPDLVRLVNDTSVDEIGLNVGAIHALRTLEGLNAYSGEAGDPAESPRRALTKALNHPSAGVRRNAYALLPRVGKPDDAAFTLPERLDSDPQVRLAQLLAFAEMKPSDAVGRRIAQQLISGAAAGDRWLTDGFTAAAAAHASPFLQAIGSTKPGAGPAGAVAPETVAVVTRVAEHLARGGDGSQVGPLLASYREANPRLTDAVLAGLARGWPRDGKIALTEADEKAMVALLPRLSDSGRTALVGLAARWGSQGLEKYTAEIAASMLATVRDESKPEAARAEAARQVVELRRKDAATARDLIGLVTPRTPPGLAAGLIAAVARSESAEVGAALVDAMKSLTPAARADAIRAVIGRSDWAPALIEGIEQGAARLDDLSLDQKQALSAHPNAEIARRAKAMIAQGGGLPDADRQKVIDQLGPIVLKAGDAAKGKIVFQQQCAKCHRHGGEGGKVGPDLTGMAAHPKAELLVNILDPSRSVEGNFVAYNVALTDGRTFNGLLASETRTAIELVDTEGKSNRILREDIEELVASKKSLMPEGFEKQVPPESLADLLEFLTQRGKFMPLDLRKVATVTTAVGMFYDKDSSIERMIFADWSPKTFEGVPFVLVDPEGGRTANAVLLHSPNGSIPPRMPRSVSLPCNAPARAIHMLSGVSGWGYAGGNAGRNRVSMIVRLHYADGQTEDHPLRDGVEFADYIRRIDVPGSKFAFALRGQQLRYLAVQPKRKEPVARIDLVKGNDPTAPIVMAVTVELPE
ncbi:MAG: PVC-type heme-binding CxxCH protein [Isosphaeraceae bacterium]